MTVLPDGRTVEELEERLNKLREVALTVDPSIARQIDTGILTYSDLDAIKCKIIATLAQM